MKNIIKIALVMLSVVSFSAAQAGVLVVTGKAKASYTIHSADSASGAVESAKGLGVSNEFDLGANGQLSNGMTWAYNINIDDATVQDDGGLSLTSKTLGSIAINISQGGLGFSNAAAITANGDRASDTGFGEGMIDEHSIGDMNNLAYATPAGLLPFGIQGKASYSPDTTAAANSSVNKIGGQNAGTFTVPTTVTSTQGANIGRTMSSYQLSAIPITGLSVGASYNEFGQVSGATAQAPESGSWYAKYAFGPATVAYGQAYVAQALDTAATDYIEDFRNKKYSIGLNANKDLSFSYSKESSVAHHKTTATANVELTSQSIAAAYTMGGMTLAVAQVDHKNVGYVANRSVQSTIFNLSMAF